MLVSGVSLDLNWFLQFIFTVFIVAVGLLHFVKNTASKYFEVDANFEVDQPVHRTPMSDVLMNDTVCFVCGNYGAKQCSRCKAVRYCSQACQQSHWKSGHKTKCGDRHPSNGIHTSQNGLTNREFRSPAEGKNSSAVALVPAYGTSRPIKQPKDVLFPYDKFVKFFNSDKLKFPPCGLVNCGNSCFGNVVLQCLSFTKPLVAYLLEKGHRRECRRNDWCFLCEFQTHVERASRSTQAFSPVNILSRLPNIGGTLGYGRQEDAHEFMRFAVDTMQSVCLDEFGGEEAVSPSLKGTTLIHHIFRGQLQSQVFCTKCDKISSLYENMMDLTVEIQGDAASLEECLEQYTDKEWLLGENMYKCEGCKDYVKAWKRLTVKQASNILTIALKRFQSGRFGKLNKRITFPETLNLGPYMSEAGDGSDIYKLYAVVVHVDMLNASFFGHYICYIKDFQGNWYRIDDWKVNRVELEEVLSQGAYMLLYNRVTALPPGLRTAKSSKEEEQNAKVEFEPGLIKQAECVSSTETVTSSTSSDVLASDDSSESKISGCENESLTSTNYEVMREHSADKDMVADSTSDGANKIPCSAVESSNVLNSEADKDLGHMKVVRPNLPSSVSEEASSDMEVQFDTCEADKDLGDMNVMRPNLPSSVSEEALSDMEVQFDTTITKSGPSPGLSNGFSSFAKDSSVLIDSVSAREDSEHTDVVKLKSLTVIPMHNSDYGNGYGSTKKPANALGDAHAVIYSNGSLPTETASAEVLQLKGGLLVQNSEIGEGNGIIEISGDIL